MSLIGVTGELNESKQLVWKIPDFFSLSATKSFFYVSPSFAFENTSLRLKIYPGGCNTAKTGFLSLFFTYESDCLFRISHSLHIKKADGTLTKYAGEVISIKSVKSIGCIDFCSRSFIEQNKSEMAPSGILTVVGILKLIQDGKRVTVTTQADNKEILHAEQTDDISDYRRLTELDVLSENFKNLSANKDSCDVVLHVEDKEFKAHKAVLMARSSTFAAMFQHDTLEKQTGFIKIPDCDSESFQEFLDYLYCGKLEDISFPSAFHLYSTSNKYDVQKLKEFCTEFLLQSLSSENLCDIVELADKYDEMKLITEAQNFFNENWSRIFLTTEWQNLMKNNFRLANNLLVEYSKAKGSQ